MRNLSILLLALAAAYLGYVSLQKPGAVARPGALQQVALPASTPEPATPEPVVETAPPAPVEEAFVSRIVIPPSEPGKKHLAPPGVFYMLERVSAEVPDGIRAVVPGEEVRLLKRLGNGSLKLTDGKTDFVIKESLVTNDLDLAQEAERKDNLVFRGKRPRR